METASWGRCYVDRTMMESTGNVFVDLELPHSDEDMLKVKIAVAISSTVSKLGLTQTDAAERMHVDQATVSRLMRGRLESISAEQLALLLRRLAGRAPKMNGPGRLQAEAVPGHTQIPVANSPISLHQKVAISATCL